MEVHIRQAEPDDLENILHVFRESIQGIAIIDYSTEQIEAWSSKSDQKKWIDRINEQHFLLCETDGVLAGFSSITKSGYLDLLFVHPDYKGKGIATRLLSQIETAAKSFACEQIESDVSITAKSVFLVMGYQVVSEELVQAGDEMLKNFRMIKKL